MIYLETPEGFKPRFEVVSCFLERAGKILLLLRSEHKPQGGTWCLPAGKIEADETRDEAILRELKEEVGYAAIVNDLVYLQAVYVRYAEYDFVYHIYRLVLERNISVTINQDEHRCFLWKTPQEALALPLIEDEDVCIGIVYNVQA